MKKILIVVNTLEVGGAERLVVDQVNCLERGGHEIHILTLSPRSKPGFYRDLRFLKGKLLDISANSLSIRGVFLISKVIRQGRYDAVISHLFLANTFTRLAKMIAFSKAKMIVYEHNTYEKEKKNRHHLTDFILSFVTYKIIAVSDPVREYLIRRRIPKNKITVVKNGVSSDFLQKLISPQEVRRNLGFNERDILIVSSGNVNPQKGYETLIDAAEVVVKKYSNVHFVVCGSLSGSYASSLKDFASLKHLEKNFHFLGPRLDATSIVNCADIFVMTSLWEGLSISLLEALLLGKLIIVSRIPSLTAIIKNDYNGLTSEVGNSQSLAELITDVISNLSHYDTLGENAKATGNRYSIESNVREILSLLN